MLDFKSLKKQSGNLEKLQKAVEAMASGNFDADKETFWKPTVDKAGNGLATIRFLPGSPVDGGDDATPWVKVYNHGFKNEASGRWYIHECPTTLGSYCPVCEANYELWNTGLDANKEIVRSRKRKLSYVSNVYIVSDPKNTDNEGKVFKFKYGKKIFDRIQEAMNPQYEDETPFSPFDFWKGANFKLKVRKVEGYPNFDRSEFEECSPLFDDDSKLEAVWKQEYSLQELIAESKFKPYDELKKEFDRVIGNSVGKSTGYSKPTTAESNKAANVGNKQVEESFGTESQAESGDEDMKYFESLANE